MGYAHIVEVDAILGQALTSSRPETTGLVKFINISSARDHNRIPDEIVNYYISLADAEIDGILTQQYVTPLKKSVNGQWELDSPIDEYNEAIILNDATNLVSGDEVVFRNEDNGYEESHIVDEVTNQKTFTIESGFTELFEVGTTRVFRLQFPPPVNQISARLAAAAIYDKYFATQNTPNVSEFGKEMRKMANGQINDILNGKIILKGQRRIGDRFGNAYLDSSYAHRTPVDGYNTTDRNKSSGE